MYFSSIKPSRFSMNELQTHLFPLYCIITIYGLQFPLLWFTVYIAGFTSGSQFTLQLILFYIAACTVLHCSWYFWFTVYIAAYNLVHSLHCSLFPMHPQHNSQRNRVKHAYRTMICTLL